MLPLQPLVTCNLLWTGVYILSQEVKGPISLSASIADMCIQYQIICNSDFRDRLQGID